MKLLTEQYADKIKGVISTYDRIILQGNLPGFNYADGMTAYLKSKNIRIFDYPDFASKFRDEIRNNAEKIAHENNIDIQFIRKHNVRKESIIQKVLKKRGDHPGLVQIISVMESCPAYKPWHDKKTGETFLRYTDGKCLHYYFYFIDKYLGLCYMRVPTWSPFRLQFYFNGHGLLASKMTQKSIGFKLLENAFVDIDNFDKAQKLADNIRVELLHKRFDYYAQLFCPIIKQLEMSYQWTVMQAEYATDIIFKKQVDLKQIYDTLIRTAIHTVKPENIATFLGRKLNGNYCDEMGNNYNVRIEGSRIKHHMGQVSVKMYDKFGHILRIETTVNNITFFKHYREVVKRDGTCEKKVAQMKKNIYSLFPLQKLLKESNHRYIEFISSIEDKSSGIENLRKISKSVVENGRPYKGFNIFDDNDLSILETIVRGEFNISGFQSKNIKFWHLGKSTGQISRILKRLRTHGLIKKIGKTYKYYLTKLGRVVAATALKLKELYIIPQLCLDRLK